MSERRESREGAVYSGYDVVDFIGAGSSFFGSVPLADPS